jgi:transposase
VLCETNETGEDTSMVTIGVDAHKRLHVATALDERGQELGHRQAANTPEGWAALLSWAVQLCDGIPRQWGIEGAGYYGHGLAQMLLADGETVYDINPRWTADSRRRSRHPGKSDRFDALAVARYLREDVATLPALSVEDETAVLDLLTSEREAALSEATRLRNQLHALLLLVDPTYQIQFPDLRTPAALASLQTYQAQRPGELAQERAASVRRLAARLQLVCQQVADLQTQIETRAEARFSPLMEIHGVGKLLAGMLAGVLGHVDPHADEAQLAMYAGVAPLEASSAGQVRHRLNRNGNRFLNAMIYRIALVQARWYPPARAYLTRRQHEGKTRREAFRALKRFIVRAVWKQWQQCRGQRANPTVAPAA